MASFRFFEARAFPQAGVSSCSCHFVLIPPHGKLSSSHQSFLGLLNPLLSSRPHSLSRVYISSISNLSYHYISGDQSDPSIIEPSISTQLYDSVVTTDHGGSLKSIYRTRLQICIISKSNMNEWVGKVSGTDSVQSQI